MSSSSNRAKRSRLRPIIFAIIPVTVLLVLASIVVSSLERWGIIETTVRDDQVMYVTGPVFRLEEGTADGQDRYVITDEMMCSGSFPARKGEDVLRIFVLGGSFAQGDPYAHTKVPGCVRGTMANWIAEDLRARYPSRKFEGISAAACSQNSHRVLEILREVLDHEPDLIFIATGNNDGCEKPAPFHRLFHRWAFYRLMRRVIVPPISDDAQRPLYTPQYELVDSIRFFFQENIDNMIRITRQADVPLVLAVMPVNLKYNPPDSEYIDTSGQATLKGYYSSAVRQAMLDYDFSDVMAITANSLSWEDFYILGAQLERQGRYDEARAAYMCSVEFYPRNRTRPSLNLVIRRLAAEAPDGVYIADLNAEARRLSPNGIPGDLLFCDYCHMHWQGYGAMSRIVVNTIVQNNLVTGADGEPLDYPGILELKSRLGIDQAYMKRFEITKPPDWIPSFSTGDRAAEPSSTEIQD